MAEAKKPARMKRKEDEKAPTAPAGDMPGEIKTEDIPKRRARMLMVNPADFMFLFTKGLKVRKNFKLIEGIPDDAVLLTIAAEPIRGGIMMVVQSEEYDEIPINQMPPIAPISIQTGHLRDSKYTKKQSSKRKK